MHVTWRVLVRAALVCVVVMVTTSVESVRFVATTMMVRRSVLGGVPLLVVVPLVAVDTRSIELCVIGAVGESCRMERVVKSTEASLVSLETVVEVSDKANAATLSRHLLLIKVSHVTLMTTPVSRRVVVTGESLRVMKT